MSRTREQQRRIRAVLEEHSRSFALAARFLPARARDDAAVLYAFCRRVDDAIDEVPAHTRADALIAVRADVDAVFGDEPIDDLVLRASRELFRARRIPRTYVDELVAGMAMDVELEAGRLRYETERDLLRYCHRVAGVVGLMCTHVLGVRADEALVPAAHLGWAMQLTNISRDVAEDWAMGRLYLPSDWFREAGAQLPTTDLPRETNRVVSRALQLADRCYAKAKHGYAALDARSGLAIAIAAGVYREIGEVLRERGCDVLAGRAIVSPTRKARVVARTCVAFAASRRGLGGSFRIPERVYELGDLLDEH